MDDAIQQIRDRNLPVDPDNIMNPGKLVGDWN
jgi:FAD/FMN-containing dehydrogenase